MWFCQSSIRDRPQSADQMVIVATMPRDLPRLPFMPSIGCRAEFLEGASLRNQHYTAASAFPSAAVNDIGRDSTQRGLVPHATIRRVRGPAFGRPLGPTSLPAEPPVGVP